MVRTNDSGTGTARIRGARLRAVSITAVLAMVAAFVLAGPSGTARAATEVGLGTADSFAVLAAQTITNTGPTTITGNVGLDPGSAVTGFDDDDPQGTVTLNGSRHIGDAVAEQAKVDLVTAYNDAEGRSPTATMGTELGGETLFGGVYKSELDPFEITGTLTLDAQNDPDTVWIFQAGSTLTTATDSSVSLINGADPCNVFWQVGSSATLDTRTDFAGTIMALTSVSLNKSAIIQGRALARNAAVTMDTNTITRVDCTPPTDDSSSPTDPSSPTDSSSPSDSPSTSEVAEPVDSTTGTTDESTGTPTAAGTPDAPVAGAPPTSGTPQVPSVPTGSVSAGDGSMTADDGPGRATAALVLAPLFAALVLYATWRRRRA